VLNQIFGTTHSDDDALTAFMKDSKTECALKLFDTAVALNMPTYINDAVA
jgi:putative ATP-dependent endonuclease of the OLD family